MRLCFVVFCGFVACLCGLVAVFLFSHRGIISLACTTNQEACYSIGFYCRIHTASKYLHNDLARAIKALEQKKNGPLSSAMQMHVEVEDFIFVLPQLEFATINSGEQCACMHVAVEVCIL